jgi:hypothetical protein
MITIERIQTGVRMEKRIVKVLKGLAEYHDISLGDLLEGIVLHAFEGKAPFGATSLQKIAELRKIYGLDLDATASHQLIEEESAAPKRPARSRKRSGHAAAKRRQHQP